MVSAAAVVVVVVVVKRPPVCGVVVMIASIPPLWPHPSSLLLSTNLRCRVFRSNPSDSCNTATKQHSKTRQQDKPGNIVLTDRFLQSSTARAHMAYNHRLTLAPCMECLRLQWKVLVSVCRIPGDSEMCTLPYFPYLSHERASEYRVGIRPRAFAVRS